jgi:hypothetical protein
MTADQLRADGVSLEGKIAKEGLGVSKLAQPIYDDVMRGDLSTARGAIIGHGIEGKPDQIALYDALKKREAGGKRLTNSQLEEMIRLAKGAPRVTESGESAQVSMFGDQEFERSLLPEKAEISEYIRKQIGGERKLFSLVGDQGAAAKLGEAGNVIDVKGNVQIAEQAARVQSLYDRLSSLAGPVDDALNQAAKRLADGENPNDVKREAYQRIRAALIEQSNRLTGVRPVDGEGAGGHAAGRLSEVEPVRPGPQPPEEPAPAAGPPGVSEVAAKAVTPPAAEPAQPSQPIAAQPAEAPKGLPAFAQRAVDELKALEADAQKLRGMTEKAAEGKYTDDTAQRRGQYAYEGRLEAAQENEGFKRAIENLDRFRTVAREKGLDPEAYLRDAGLPEQWLKGEAPPLAAAPLEPLSIEEFNRQAAVAQQQHEASNPKIGEALTKEIQFGRGKALPDLEDSPLFGGPRQGGMFDEPEEAPPSKSEPRDPRRGGISPELLSLGAGKF